MEFLQVALKRQQAVEDAIALRLVSNETGKPIEALPPGKIFGMSVTKPCSMPSNTNDAHSRISEPKHCKQNLDNFFLVSFFFFLL